MQLLDNLSRSCIHSLRRFYKIANYRLHVHLNEKEHAHLMQQVQVTGLSRSALVRSLILNSDIRPRPPDEFASLLRNLSGISNNINQITKIANANGKISDASIQKATALVQDAWQLVKDNV